MLTTKTRSRFTMVMQILRSRKFAKRVLIGLLILIIPAFVLWGVGNLSKRPGPVGKIEGRKISLEEFAKSRQGIKVQILFSYFGDMEALGNILQNRPLMNFMAWERLMLLNEAREKDIKITNDQLLAFITRHPLFQRKGVFDKNIYAYVLKNNLSMDPRQFEELVRQNLRIQALRQDLLQDVTVSEDELLRVYKKRNDKVRLSYIFLDKDSFGEDVTVTEEEILSSYQENKGNFLEPAKTVVEYIEFPYEDTSERDSAMRKIEKVYEELARDPEGLRRVAGKYGLEYGKTPPFSREEVVPGVVFFTGFSEMAFSLKEGEISTPVFSSPDKGAGYILRKTDQIPPRPMKFEEVRGKIRQQLVDEKKIQAAENVADRLYLELASGEATLTEEAKAMNTEVRTTGDIAINDYIENIGPAKKIVAIALETPEGKVMQPVTVKKGIFLGRVEKVIPADEKTFEKEKKQLRRELRTTKQMQAMDDWFKKERRKTRLYEQLDQL
ncbi:MAG: hypothetical protein GF409_08440 [Candidatus Omnitrophica bacterium]|nr:hypothetical protein [Candidatus Omnitrophota bacterium]